MGCAERHHKNECYDFEADIILLYPGPDDKIHVVLNEVKRSTDPQKLSKSLIAEALVQLKKDTQFMGNVFWPRQTLLQVV